MIRFIGCPTFSNAPISKYTLVSAIRDLLASYNNLEESPNLLHPGTEDLALHRGGFAFHFGARKKASFSGSLFIYYQGFCDPQYALLTESAIPRTRFIRPETTQHLFRIAVRLGENETPRFAFLGVKLGVNLATA